MDGGELLFQMSNVASDWATKDAEVPTTQIEENLIVLTPFLSQGEVAFKDQTTVALEVPQEGTAIYYSLDDGDFTSYEKPFVITEATLLKTYATKGKDKSATLSTSFNKIDKNLSVQLETEYANEYNAGGNDALIDGILGSKDFRTGAWQGYWGIDVKATINRGQSKLLKTVTVNFLEDQGSWIFYPTKVQVYVAGADKKYRLSRERFIDAGVRNDEPGLKTMQFPINKHNIQFVKVVAKNFGKLPSWHLGGPDGDAWTFIDEITIK
jgi:hypothetical protein